MKIQVKITVLCKFAIPWGSLSDGILGGRIFPLHTVSIEAFTLRGETRGRPGETGGDQGETKRDLFDISATFFQVDICFLKSFDCWKFDLE